MQLNLTRPIIIFDLETTGIQVATDRIVEISLMRVSPDESEEIWTQRINPTIPIPPQSSAIHHIMDEDVKDKPTFSQIAKQVAAFIGHADLAGYNSIRFDIPLLVEEFLRAGIDFDIKNRRFIDVQNIFHRMEQRTLSAAYKFYCNQEHTGAHGAESDTVVTYEILKAQLDRYNGVSFTDANGKTTNPVVNDMNALHEFSNLTNNADLVGHLIFNSKGEEVINFGKHKGKTVESVFSSEPSYYDWMMKADFPLSTKRVITAIKLRGFNKGSIKPS
ncbi:MAG: exonuclease domain-containing protein [Bacteroidales bacterium]